MSSLHEDLATARTSEYPDAKLCARIARQAAAAGDDATASAWAVRTVDGGFDTTAWTAASKILVDRPRTDAARQVALTVVGTANTDVLSAVLPVALARERVTARVTHTGFGLYWQQILDPTSELYRQDPDVVVLVPHLAATSITGGHHDPDAVLESELRRWTSAWERLRDERSRHIVQVGFVAPDADPLGHLAAAHAASRLAMTRALNARLATAAADADVGWVDAESLAARAGHDRWFDPRWWFVAKHEPSMSASPVLAHHVAVVTAARLGLARKCLVTDLDGTLWGGSIGDDGVGGIGLAGTPDGEAHLALQRVMKQLEERGVILAVCSKNTEAIARSPFTEHPEMVLGLEDFAVFIANWEPKPANIRQLATRLGIGLDALAFLDDNPAEREAVRAELPEVDVIRLPDEPTGFPAALARYPRFETPVVADEDRSRTSHYRARAEAETARASATSVEDFLVDMEMKATFAPVDPSTENRTAQLLGKTNQWNMTTRRHTLEDVRRIASDDRWITMTGRLEDRLTDHGLVAVVLARQDGDVVDVDTFLMSCRVIGRQLEHAAFDALVDEARRRGCATVTANYVPTGRNAVVAETYADLGMSPAGSETDGSTRWTLDVASYEPHRPPIAVSGGAGTKEDSVV